MISFREKNLRLQLYGSLGDVHVQVNLGQISFVDPRSSTLNLGLSISISPGADHVRCFLR